MEKLLEVGFIKCIHDKISSTSPDAMSIISCSQLEITHESHNLYKVSELDLSKYLIFIERGRIKYLTADVDCRRYFFPCTHE